MSLIVTVVKSRQEMMEFIKLPWLIYKNDRHWVPPLIVDMKKMLDKRKHPFFQHSEADFFLAHKDGKVVGRIAAILNNNHNEFHNERIGFFGFFESIDDREVSTGLFDAAGTWFRQRGLTHMRGPASFSTNETCGLLIDGFESSPVIMMSYNPEYYLDLVGNAGLAKTKELYAYYFNANMTIPERFERIANKTLKDESVAFRNINLRDFGDEVERVKKVYNEAWQNNWGFVPMTDAEFEHLAKDLKPIIDPAIVFLAEVNDEVAGFSLAIPDYNQILKEVNGRLFPFGLVKLLINKRKINRIRVVTLGVVNKFQKKRGLAPTFYYRTYHDGKKKGYSLAEFSWILEDNTLMNRALVAMGAKLYKKYAIYEKPI